MPARAHTLYAPGGVAVVQVRWETGGVEAAARRLRAGEIAPAEALRLAADSRRRSGTARVSQEEADRQQRIAAVMAELDGLIGLSRVKQTVREIRAFAEIGRRRRACGLLADTQSLHMVFTGNPGTGKTTVARILGRLLREVGVLSRGHLVEAERADLVGEYIGHTAQKTREAISRAQGGVLFVDEAYSLARGGEKDFGKESIDCLVKAVEDRRADVICILAGYPAEMDWFLTQNPGLRSRFPILIRFSDYTADDLVAIAAEMLAQKEYRLAPEALPYLRLRLCASPEGNARSVRNLVERAIRCQALRLVGKPSLSRDDLMEITRSDLQQALARSHHETPVPE
jgi:stage V sporulation protein K